VLLTGSVAVAEKFFFEWQFSWHSQPQLTWSWPYFTAKVTRSTQRFGAGAAREIW
jgi:hypothetical protein